MLSISTDIRVTLWIVAAIAGGLAAVIGNVLAVNVVYLFTRRGRPPTRRPIHIWTIFFLSLGISIGLGSLAAFAPSSEQNNIVETEYVGRVIEINSQQPIVGAKITLDLQGVPPIVYTDSEGIYRFKVVVHSEITGRVRVDAEGYQTYTRNITISPDIKTIEDIRLTRLAATKVPKALIEVSVTINSAGYALLSSAALPRIENLGSIDWEIGFESTLYDAKSQSNILFIIFLNENGEIIQYQYDMRQPFDIDFSNANWVRRMKREDNGSIVVFVEQQVLVANATISCDAGLTQASLRRSPGYINKDDSTDIIYKVDCGQTVMILGATQKADDLIWWKVYWNGYTGWMADHTGKGRIILIFNQ